MTLPRQVLPGMTVMVTRRTHAREFTLCPGEQMNELFGYLLAVGTAKYGLGVLAGVCMSDHYHLVLIDRDGAYPAFVHWFNTLLARATNRLRDRQDSLWSGDGAHVAELADEEAVMDRAAYALANPVQHGAVAHGRDWPGFRTRPQGCATRPTVFQRPNWFFSAKGKMPAEATLRIVASEHAEGAGAFSGLLARAVGEREERARAKMTDGGGRFAGPAACRTVSWECRAVGWEPTGPGNNAGEVVSRDEESGEFSRSRLAGFRASYEEARRRWCAGDRELIWPAGTWLMVTRHRLPAHHPPP